MGVGQIFEENNGSQDPLQVHGAPRFLYSIRWGAIQEKI